MGEPIETKALRYIAEGRVRVLVVRGERVFAEVHGSREFPYHAGEDASGRSWCNCPARRDCAHLVALRMVLAPREDRRAFVRGGAKADAEKVDR